MKNLNFSAGQDPHNQGQIYNEQGQTVAVTYNDKEAKTAQLFAAAPDLLEALENLLYSHRVMTFEQKEKIGDTPIERMAAEAIRKAKSNQ